MGKRIVLALLALSIALPSFAQNVDEGELESVAGRTIEFINYVGPYARIDSAEDIRAIGRSLGLAVRGGAGRSGELGRYYVIHAVDPSVPAGLDADILILGEGARVDHIRNLRRIIAGYLEGAYAYSAADADTLAVFITIYNAVYRGDLGYFGAKYKPVVTRELGATNAGLALRWDEWAGRSRIVIPLTSRAAPGVIGSVDSTPITDKPTVESLKKEDPQAAIEERRDVVDIKERDVEQEKAAIEEERQRIAAQEESLADEKAEREAQAAAERTDAARDGQAEQGPGQEASLVTSEEAKAEEEAIAQKEAAIEAQKEELAKREESVAAKEEEIAADRQAIAQDQKEAIAGEVQSAAQREAAGVVLFELMDPNQPLARIVLVDIKTGETLRKSELNTIRTATVVDLGGAYAAVAGQATGTGGAVRLVRVEKADYAKVIQGADDVFADTQLWKFGSSLYAVTKKGSGWAIGRFDPATLELKASSAPVSRYTFLTEHDGKLVAQKPDSGFLILDREALTTVAEVKR
jgi:hypothetical protein